MFDTLQAMSLQRLNAFTLLELAYNVKFCGKHLGAMEYVEPWRFSITQSCFCDVSISFMTAILQCKVESVMFGVKNDKPSFKPMNGSHVRKNR